MNIRIESPVAGNFKNVYAHFDRALFEALAPPGMNLDIVRFEGSSTGNIVHIRLKILGLIKQEWISKITGHGEESQQAWFIDEGVQLPGFLSSWKHRHIVKAHKGESMIIDDITYQTPFLLLDYLFYPVMYLQFALRRPVYKRYFRSLYGKT